ncbi:MAG: four helix bundle protein [Acidobacteriota bacterium]
MAPPPARTFEDLVVWQKGHALVLRVYRVTAGFPKTEIYGLTAQMRQAASSIPANIAEGFKRASRPDKARLLNVAQGSAEELRYYLRLAHDLGYLVSGEMAADLDEVSRLLDAYRRKILSSQA